MWKRRSAKSSWARCSWRSTSTPTSAIGYAGSALCFVRGPNETPHIGGFGVLRSHRRQPGQAVGLPGRSLGRRLPCCHPGWAPPSSQTWNASKKYQYCQIKELNVMKLTVYMYIRMMTEINSSKGSYNLWTSKQDFKFYSNLFQI